MKVNGVDVIACRRVEWADALEASDLPGTVIAARALVLFANGGAAHGLVLERGAVPCAVVWERTTCRFVLVPLDVSGAV